MNLSVLTGDSRCMKSTRRWVEAILVSQDADGYFGPRSLKAIRGKKRPGPSATSGRTW